MTIERDVSTIALGTRTVSVTQTNYAGSPAWLLLENRSGDGIPAADSLLVDVLSLHPVHWSSTLGQARIAAEFRGDSAFGALSAPATRRSIVVELPAGTIVSGPRLEAEHRTAHDRCSRPSSGSCRCKPRGRIRRAPLS
jgi:hypothetical protein